VKITTSRLTLCLIAAGLAVSAARATAAQTPLMLTVTTAGVSANESVAQGSLSLSSDGRMAAFVSGSSGLVAGDSNGVRDVFVRDLVTGATTRVSVSSSGAQSNGASSNAQISGNGRFVVFSSQASNLVADDTNGASDVFVRDLANGTTARVSVSSSGAQGNGSSGDAASDISADGRFVSFSSAARNLVDGDTNGVRDVFVADRQSGDVERVSVPDGGGQTMAGNSDASAISANGQVVAFVSTAPNLVDGDTNLAADVFVRDRGANSTVRASVSAAGDQAGSASQLRPGGLSADGTVVAFETNANLVPGDTANTDVYVRDLAAGATERISVNSAGQGGNAGSASPTLSADGRYVSFESSATNLDAADTGADKDVFVRDRVAGQTKLVTTSSSAIQISQSAALSGDGRFLALASTAADFAAGDSPKSFNDGWDAFRFASPFDPPSDRQPPRISCQSDDGSWHAQNVSLRCTASDDVSGLSASSQAAFTLSTDVAAGDETGDAETDSVRVCDRAGNCATAGPFDGIHVDRRPPSITISSPSGGDGFTLGQAAKASYGCDDGGSGVASCGGDVADGGALDTSSVGAHVLTVTAVDAVGNRDRTQADYWVHYPWGGWQLPASAGTGRTLQPGRAVPIGFTVPGAGSNAVTGVTVAEVSCSDGTAGPESPADGAVRAGDAGSFQLVWKTSKAFAGGCRRLSVHLDDGSAHALVFDFR